MGEMQRSPKQEGYNFKWSPFESLEFKELLLCCIPGIEARDPSRSTPKWLLLTAVFIRIQITLTEDNVQESYSRWQKQECLGTCILEDSKCNHVT